VRLLNYKRRPRIMVVAHGHPYQRDAFMKMFDRFPEAEAFIVEHPVAPKVLNPSGVGDVDAIVLYDMPGGSPAEGPDYHVDPSEEFKKGFLELLDRGMPIVALHHAIGGWPSWHEYAELLGGKLIHFPDVVRGRRLPDGGYRQNVTYELSAVDESHPIFAGMPKRFTIEDEVYLFDVFADAIAPLVRSSYPAVSEGFHSLALGVKGKMHSSEGWSRPPGSDIVGWTKMARNSPLVYLQAGHGPTAYANPDYVQLLCNSIKWTISQCHRTF
jgi:uncharacterized protein